MWVAVAVSVAPVAGRAAAVQAAQAPDDGSWTLATWVQGAFQIPTGRLATAPSNLPELQLASSVADLEGSFMVAGGLDVAFPDRELGLRLGFETTIGAEATSQLGICEVAQGPICDPEIVSATVRGITAELRTYSGNPEWILRPILGGGFGWRFYSFEVPDCSVRARGQPRLVCDLNSDFFRTDSQHVVLRAVVGARAGRERMTSELTLGGGVGKYGGGTQRVNGNWNVDIRIALSASLRVL